jgi:hypothetical protein
MEVWIKNHEERWVRKDSNLSLQTTVSPISPNAQHGTLTRADEVGQAVSPQAHRSPSEWRGDCARD